MKEGDRFKLRKTSVLYSLFGDKIFNVEQIDIVTDDDGSEHTRVLFFIDKVLYFELEKHIDLICHNEYHNLKEIKKIIIEFNDGRTREYNKPTFNDTQNHIKIKDNVYDNYTISISINNIY